MNSINILNLAFYLLPFLVMGIDHYAHKIPSRIQQLVFILFCCILGIAFSYTLFMPLAIILNFIPSYLFCYYSGTFLVTGILHNILNRSNQLQSITRSFLIVYFSSFFWEFPENIYWQTRHGFNPIILSFSLLSCFSYIYLNNTIGWKKTRTNYILMLSSWGFTIIGVLTLPSSVHCRWLPYLHPCAIYFVFCRFTALLVLIKIFILDHYLPQTFHRILKEGSFLTYAKWVLYYIVIGNWRLGTEMGYWDFEINHNRPEGWSLPFLSDEIKSAIDKIAKNIGLSGKEIKVIEIGPGPRSRLTEGYDKGLFDLVSIDPLANDFKEYLNGRAFLVQGTAEKMWEQYPPKSFHIAYASNVLDHTENPQLCFHNLWELTKTGGFIIIHSNENEGTRTDWQGLHKHDMWIDGDKLMCKTQYGKPFILSNGSLETVSIGYEPRDNNPWFAIMFRRLGR